MKLAPTISSILLFSRFVFASTTSTIGLDNAEQYRCSFDVNVCGWAMEGPIYNGPGGCDHGWPNDTSNGVTASGMYVCFFLEHLPTVFPDMDRARLTSPTINTTHHLVFSFAVGTVRPPNSTYLNVILVNETGVETLLCSTSELLSPWQRIYVGVVQPGPYQIVIEGVPDLPFYPNFGIDDLTLTAVENASTINNFSPTTSQTEITSGISKNPAFKTTPQEETSRHPIPSKTLMTTSKKGEVPTKSLATNTTSKDGQVGQQSGHNDNLDIIALAVVPSVVGCLIAVAGALFYIRKIRNKRSSFSVERSRKASGMVLSQTELIEL
ncbi:Hypp1281 [Branchiostoma lanceolatum]|uniref:Hypp1281 protein n=1 Tax=Branchiostoma lanceolatum TaxID=7740 RepID=A0A8K0EMS6_BRALA|nr:Hypp1281 [Branchiostoma lanceolatum]